MSLIIWPKIKISLPSYQRFARNESPCYNLNLIVLLFLDVKSKKLGTALAMRDSDIKLIRKMYGCGEF